MTQAANNLPLVGLPMYGGYLTKELCYSSKPARAAWLRILGGMNRLLWEHASGEELTDPTTGQNIPPCAPRNARGLLGEAHMGAPFGKALTTSFFVWANQDMSSTPVRYTTPALISGEPAGGTGDRTYGFRSDLYVPVPAGPAFTAGRVHASIHCSTASSGNELTLSFRNLTTDPNYVPSLTFDVASTGFVAPDSPGYCTIGLTPGEINKVRATLYSEDADVVTAYIQTVTISKPA